RLCEYAKNRLRSMIYVLTPHVSRLEGLNDLKSIRGKLGRPAAGDGLRLRDDLRAAAGHVDRGRGLAKAPRVAPGRVGRGRQDRLDAGRSRQRDRPGLWRRGEDRPEPRGPAEEREQALRGRDRL